MKKTIFTILITLTQISFAQIGPSLTGGAEGLVAKQGQLDAQVILDAIATKKGELKSELGKRLILNKLLGSPYALYDYTEKNLQLLFGQENKSVITKEFMKNSAELLIVYGMAEYLLQDMASKKNRTYTEDSLLKLFLHEVDSTNRKQLIFSFSKKPDTTEINLPGTISNMINKDYNLQRIFGDAEDVSATLLGSVKGGRASSQTYLLKPDITRFLSNNTFSKYKEGKNKYYTAMSMFIDMIYDACITNESVLSTGLFQSINHNKERYEAMSKFLYFKKNNPIKIYKPLADYKLHVDSILTYLFSYYNLFVEVGDLYDSKDGNDLKNKIQAATFHKNEDIEKLIALLKKQAGRVKSMKNISDMDNLYKDEILLNKKIIGIESLLPRLKKGMSTDSTQFAKYYLDLTYTLQKEIIPNLSTMNMLHNGAYDSLITSCQLINANLFDNALKIFGRNPKIKSLITCSENYLPLLDIINNLDKVESYDKVFKFLTGIAETIGDQQTKTIVKAITTNVDRFITIDKQKNEIKLDVEGLAATTFDRFGKNQRTAISMLFLVGASHNTSTGNNSQFITSDSPDTLGFSQFISEKIGLRFNLVDWNRRRAFSRNYTFEPKRPMRKASKIGVDPIVNNLHAIIYASGLLYKIQALNSAEQFTKPILAAGLGITFFNGLDFNLSYAMPYTFNPEQGFLSVSFDIAITEYLTLLKSKKKN